MEGKRKHLSKSQIWTESFIENMTYFEEVKFISNVSGKDKLQEKTIHKVGSSRQKSRKCL